MTIWKRIDNSSAGYSGECCYIWGINLEEGGDYLIANGEESDRYGWLMDEWADYCAYEDQDPSIWNEIFDILRSHFGRLETVACYSEVNIEIAEDFLRFLCTGPAHSFLVIDTGIDSPEAIGYILDRFELENNWWTLHRGKLVPTELALVVEATDVSTDTQEEYKNVSK